MDVLSSLRSRFGLNNLQLKIIAVVSMLIDHTADALPVFHTASVRPLYMLMRYAGRLAFPLFAFLLAVGAEKTHDKKKYLLRLGVFALLSEVPFDWALFGRPVCWERQNVFFTLFLALLSIAVWRA